MIRHILRARLAAAIRAAAVFGFPVAVTAAPAEIAVVIDDLGYRDAAGQRAGQGDGAVTVAILPHTRFGAGPVRAAHASGILRHVKTAAAPRHGGWLALVAGNWLNFFVCSPVRLLISGWRDAGRYCRTAIKTKANRAAPY
ncbi:MAG: hypothetical protein PVG76_00460 [Chromatiales bacterium]